MDLLTAVMHELGHVLGAGHSRADDDLMGATLQTGVRKLVHGEARGPASVDSVFDQLADEERLLLRLV